MSTAGQERQHEEQLQRQGEERVEQAAEAVEHDLQELQRKARERDEFLDLLQRVRADYANYQKRVARQLEEARRFAVAPFARDLLGVVDNLERAIEAAEKVQGAEAIVEGIRLVYQELMGVLQRHGIQPVAPDGETFDPAYHEAVAQEPSETVPPGRVLRTLQRGYMLHERLLRPARVVVSQAPAPQPAAPQEPAAQQGGQQDATASTSPPGDTTEHP